MKYQTLKAGDVRKKGDEVRSRELCVCDARHNPRVDAKLDITKWRETELIGWEIFKSDVAHLDFRRPIK